MFTKERIGGFCIGYGGMGLIVDPNLHVGLLLCVGIILLYQYFTEQEYNNDQ